MPFYSPATYFKSKESRMKRLRSLYLLIAILLIFPTWAISANGSNSDWTWQYPLPTGNSLFFVKCLDTAIGIAVGSAGTILRTTDAGITWSNQASGTSVSLYTISFDDSTNIMTVSGQGGIIIYSADRGITWSHSLKNTESIGCVHSTIGTPSDPEAANNRGMHMHASHANRLPTDGDVRTGHTTSTSSCGGIAIGPGGWIAHWVLNPLCVAALGQIGLQDCPYEWGGNSSSGTVQNLNSIDFFGDSTGIIVGEGNTILRSTDCGGSWELIMGGGPSFMLNHIAVSGSSTQIAVGDHGTILRTNDGGVTWIDTVLGSTYVFNSISGTDNSFWVVGDSGVIMKSNDNGTTWEKLSSFTSYNLNGVTFRDSETGTAVGGPGLVFHTTDGGSTWSLQTTNTTDWLYAVDFVSSRIGTVVGALGRIIHTTNQGETWTTQSYNQDYSLYDVSFSDSLNGAAVGSFGTILRTTDGGATWRKQESGISRGVLYSVALKDSDYGIIAGDGGLVLYTTNGGALWSPQECGTQAVLKAVTFTDSGGATLVGANGAVLHASSIHPDVVNNTLNVDAGWDILSIPSRISDRSKAGLFPSSTAKAYEYVHGYVQRDTLEYGHSYWIKHNAAAKIPLTGIPLDTQFVVLRKGWNMVGSISYPIAASGVLAFPSDLVTSQFFGYNGHYYSADSLNPGRGYWILANEAGVLRMAIWSSIEMKNKIRIVHSDQVPPPPPTEDGSTSGLPNQYALIQNYPNPFNPTTTIMYHLPEASKVKLAVFNTLGQVIAILKDEVGVAGFHSVDWNAAHVASGIYFYKLEAACISNPSKSFSQVRKMVLLK